MRRLLGTVTAIGLVFLAPKSARADEDVEPLPVAAAPTAVVAVPVASAPTGRADAVYLRSGGMVRGRVHEIIPGHHVTATLEVTGETRVIPWAEIDRVVLGDATALPPPPGASILASSAASAPPMAGPRAHVHISTPKTVQLFRRPAGTTGWTNACASPCDIDLPLGDDYRVTGSGVAQSKEFHLQGAPGERLEIVVDPTSASGLVAGGLLAGTGAFAMYVGFLTTLVGIAQTNQSCTSYYGYSSSSQCLRDNQHGPAVRNVGLGILLAGTAAAVIGLVVVVNSAGTDVSQHGAAAHAPKDAFLREPVWRGVATANEAGTMMFPLLSRNF